MLRVLALVLTLVGCTSLMGAKKEDVVHLTTSQLKAAMKQAYDKGYESNISKYDSLCRPNI